jgi:hypothetical protein
VHILSAYNLKEQEIIRVDSLLVRLTPVIIQSKTHLNNEASILKQLITKYHDVPMSLADVCLVRMAELDH